MPQSSPSGIIGVARLNLRNLIASSVTFQAQCGVGDETAAKEFVYFQSGTPAEVSLPDFFAVIGNRFDGGPDSYDALSYGGTSSVTGAVGVEFYAIDAAAVLEYNEITRILNITDGILAEMNVNRTVHFDFLHVDVWQPILTNEDDRSSDRNYITRACQFAYGPSPG